MSVTKGITICALVIELICSFSEVARGQQASLLQPLAQGMITESSQGSAPGPPEVRRRFPVIAESLLFAASGRLRNMATMGGNIMQRTRCAYFRDEDGLPCNKRQPGSGWSALHGLNRNHAIFGWSDDCVATNPSDVALRIAALDANVIVRGRGRERSIPFTEFHVLPGNTPKPDNVLERSDLILAIEVPTRIEGRTSYYLKVRDRQSLQ